MGYRSLAECVADLERTGQLLRLDHQVDPYLEVAEIQRRVFRAGGPAILFTRVKGCRFPLLGNLFGTMERVRYIFRDSLEMVAKLATLQVDPADLMRRPRLYIKAPWWAWYARPKAVGSGAVLAHETSIDQLPQIVSWPGDGGPYITLPQVYTEDPDQPGFDRSNLGMYRIQLGGGKYVPNLDLGLHYQIHRGIAQHHAAALRRGESLRVNIFVGGPPAMTVAAVMPLPEGVSELRLAGLLNRRRIRMIRRHGKLPIHADADFCITATLDPNRLLPEGPFGDHLGYYSLAHEFPVLRVEHVYHRSGAIWPFTVVGRPPQEDAMFARLIHELVGPIVPKTIPGVRAVNAVEAAGVHPLLLAIGSERYVPYQPRSRPRELLTLANALLGYGQLSLAKYLFIVAAEDAPHLDVNDVAGFFRHVLERVDWRRDLHFQTCTNMDTLDYSGPALNEGSKLIVAAAGPPVRTLPVALDSRISLPRQLGFNDPRVFLPGILVVGGPAYRRTAGNKDEAIERFCSAYDRNAPINNFPLIAIVDDSAAATRSLNDFLWTCFTRSDPAADVYGIDSFYHDKHWGCHGSLVIDARAKPHHAPPLVEDPAVSKRVDALAARGGPLHGII